MKTTFQEIIVSLKLALGVFLQDWGDEKHFTVY